MDCKYCNTSIYINNEDVCENCGLVIYSQRYSTENTFETETETSTFTYCYNSQHRAKYKKEYSFLKLNDYSSSTYNKQDVIDNRVQEIAKKLNLSFNVELLKNISSILSKKQYRNKIRDGIIVSCMLKYLTLNAKQVSKTLGLEIKYINKGLDTQHHNEILLLQKKKLNS